MMFGAKQLASSTKAFGAISKCKQWDRFFWIFSLWGMVPSFLDDETRFYSRLAKPFFVKAVESSVLKVQITTCRSYQLCGYFSHDPFNSSFFRTDFRNKFLFQWHVSVLVTDSKKMQCSSGPLMRVQPPFFSSKLSMCITAAILDNYLNKGDKQVKSINHIPWTIINVKIRSWK
jgi:hypothetical protein